MSMNIEYYQVLLYTTINKYNNSNDEQTNN